MADVSKLKALARLVRYYILKMTTKAGSGHLTSSLSAADVMTCLFFDKLRFDLRNVQNSANDRVIFSKGHASPLMYALYAVCGVLSEDELDTYREFKSPLEGHPTANFKYAEVATGSLGQGLSIGLGMALALKSERAKELKSESLPIVYVLMGDSEMAEGSVWEAIELAFHYKLGNLVGIIDVNRLGQSGETMLGWEVETYKKRVEAFGWEVIVVDGHNFEAIVKTFDSLSGLGKKPVMTIAKTIKGKGVSFLENKEGWHGKVLPQEDFEKAVEELGKINLKLRGGIQIPRGPVSSFPPASARSSQKTVIDPKDNVELRAVGTPSRTAIPRNLEPPPYKIGEEIATRKAFGEALTVLGDLDSRIVSLDAEVKNSTFAEIFKEKHPDRFFEMFIAEQNMVGTAIGMAKRGKIPFVSTFATFFTRAFDQIRMGAYSGANIKFVGSHAGVSIGEDGPSQMGLEDFAQFRAVFGSVVLCPGDAVATWKLVQKAAGIEGIFYIRTNRPATPVIYKEGEEFQVGGSKVVRSSSTDRLTIVACGVTLFEALKAADELAREGINVRVIDAYSVKPIDEAGLRKAASECNNIVITVEDHYFEGGLGDAVLNAFAQDGKVRVHKLAVAKMPMSGKPQELLDYEGISAGGIVGKVREILASK